MVGIKENYPYSCNDQELNDKIAELNIEIAKTESVVLVHKYSALSQTGILELNSRQLSKQIINFEKQNEANKISTRNSLIIAFLAIIASALSVFFAYRDDIADTIWQDKQLKVLNTSDSLLNNIDSLLTKNIFIYNNTKAKKNKSSKTE